MAEKKQKGKKPGVTGVTYVIISILVILVLLVILYWFTYSPVRIPDSFAPEAGKTENKKEALDLLDRVRKRKDFAYPVVSSPGFLKPELTEHTHFSLGYSEEHEQAAWVAYIISRVHTRNTSERRNNFREDPKISTTSASPKDYSKSGYDRGHLAPAGDFDFNKKALSETFYMSNISPQDPSLNRGSWKELEDLVRDLATERDSLWVVSGPVLERGLKKIGRNKVSVPKYFYKIILDARPSSLSALGFLMPNEKISAGPGNFVVSVDSIEVVSGLDFFPLLPDVLENAVEKKAFGDGLIKKQKR